MRFWEQHKWRTAIRGSAFAVLALPMAAFAGGPAYDCARASGQVMAQPGVSYDCGDGNKTPFFAAFYADTDPASVVLTSGQDQVIAFRVPSGSGAKYSAPGVEFWEHHGEATVNWFGTERKCRVIH